ncbi:DJ-1/PfpI family protein [Candidatus Undinarchaeota archaeon]
MAESEEIKKKVLMVLAPSNYRPAELYEPKNILGAYGASVVVASKKSGAIAGMPVDNLEWQSATADLRISDVNLSDYDAIIFIGGSGVRDVWDDSEYINLAKAAADTGMLICAICIAPMILANANLLTGKEATIHNSEVQTFLARNVAYVDVGVVETGNIITAAGPHVASEFGERIAEKLGIARGN